MKGIASRRGRRGRSPLLSIRTLDLVLLDCALVIILRAEDLRVLQEVVRHPQEVDVAVQVDVDLRHLDAVNGHPWGGTGSSPSAGSSDGNGDAVNGHPGGEGNGSPPSAAEQLRWQWKVRFARRCVG